jgi:hypothetical protein
MDKRKLPIALACAGMLAAAPLTSLATSPKRAEASLPSVRILPVADERPDRPNPAVKPFDRATARLARVHGSSWLTQHQNSDGGWGAGSWGASGGVTPSDVATTSLAVMALLRDGGHDGTHRAAIEKGVRFVVRTVEATPADGPGINGPDGTQPQRKLGRNVDTHFASLMMGQLSGRLPGELDARLQVAYDKVLSKVVAAQRADGSFDSEGWAPVLSSSVAAQSLSRAYELGKPIAPEALALSDDYQQTLVDRDTGSFDASAGAGVALYAAASTLRSNSDAAKRAQSDEERERAEAAAGASKQAVQRDPGTLMAGFGSVGGEEMLSYMMISDSLAEAGGDPWKEWEQRIGNNLVATQNADGSWSGHHCITSTTFVTAAAVMTLASGDAVLQKQARAD